MKSQFGRAIFTLLAFTFMFSGMAQAETAKQPQVVHESGDWQIYGESPHYLDLGLGVFDANGDGDESGAARAELRFGKKVFFIGPAIGFLANLDGGYFGYGGIYADIIYKRLAITPFAGAGGYEDGDGMDQTFTTKTPGRRMFTSPLLSPSDDLRDTSPENQLAGYSSSWAAPVF